MTKRIDISLGPVQGFVTQSRRTRDLWGSSYLLSFLAGHAMYGAREAGGLITQPLVDDDPLYNRIRGRRSGAPPLIGTLPNHFVVEADGDARLIADAAKAAMDAAWHRLSHAVWARYVDHASADGERTERIWGRQIDGFWNLVWTSGPAEGYGLLARRKLWRSHRLPDEPGDKCTVMSDWQELSGHIRSRGTKSRENQDRFWRRIRGRSSPLDIREDERLCAIALIKRLFPKLSNETLGWPLDASHWPSTVYVGAAPWVNRVSYAAPEAARRYAESVRTHVPDALTERRGPIDGAGESAAGDFHKLDANYYHHDQVMDERLCPLGEKAPAGARQELARLLHEVYNARSDDDCRIGPPSSFYALLLADGDRLGRLAAERGGATVGKALARFTEEVQKIIRNHQGITIYAGGDDVMAMLPVPGALACAEALAQTYRTAFEGQPAATLSAAVLFAHVRNPLGPALATTRRLLDDVAKESNGRDSLVAAVLNPGGLSCQWVTTWQRTTTDHGQSSSVCQLNELVDRLKSDAAEPGLSSSLIYRVRETLSALCGWDRWKPGAWGPVPEGLDIRAFLNAEILQSLTVRMEEGAEARAAAMGDVVWRLLGRSSSSDERDSKASLTEECDSRNTDCRNLEAGIDVLLLARFLVTSGCEEDR